MGYFYSAEIDYDLDKNLDEALVNCELALQLNPNFAEAHNLRGLILDEMGRTDDAIASYREALRVDSAEEARANLRDAEAEQMKICYRIPQAIGLVEQFGPSTRWICKVCCLRGLCVILVGLGLFFSFKYINEFATAYLMPKSPIIFVPDLPEGTVG